MAISGLVITLDETDPQSEQMLLALQGDDRYELGPRQGNMVPVVLDTASAPEQRACLNGLGVLPGVLAVELVIAHYEGAAR